MANIRTVGNDHIVANLRIADQSSRDVTSPPSKLLHGRKRQLYAPALGVRGNLRRIQNGEERIKLVWSNVLEGDRKEAVVDMIPGGRHPRGLVRVMVDVVRLATGGATKLPASREPLSTQIRQACAEPSGITLEEVAVNSIRDLFDLWAMSRPVS